MREYVNNFQTVTKLTTAAEEQFDIQIKDYNSITIINNSISNIVALDNSNNYILPNGVININGDTDQFLHGVLRIILFEQVIGFPPPKVVVIKKRYNNAAV